MTAVSEYSDTPSSRKWRLVKRRLADLNKATRCCIDFRAELGGNVGAGAEPLFASEQSQHEYALIGSFIAERAFPFIAFWEDAIASG
jgi:hypothetical protein